MAIISQKITHTTMQVNFHNKCQGYDKETFKFQLISLFLTLPGYIFSQKFSKNNNNNNNNHNTK